MKNKIISILCLSLVFAFCICFFSGCDKSIGYFTGTYVVTKHKYESFNSYWGSSSNYNSTDYLKNKKEIRIEVKENGEVNYIDPNTYTNKPVDYQIKDNSIKFLNTIVDDHYLTRKESDGKITLEYYHKTDVPDGAAVNRKITITHIILEKVA